MSRQGSTWQASRFCLLVFCVICLVVALMRCSTNCSHNHDLVRHRKTCLAYKSDALERTNRLSASLGPSLIGGTHGPAKARTMLRDRKSMRQPPLSVSVSSLYAYRYWRFSFSYSSLLPLCSLSASLLWMRMWRWTSRNRSKHLHRHSYHHHTLLRALGGRLDVQEIIQTSFLKPHFLRKY